MTDVVETASSCFLVLSGVVSLVLPHVRKRRSRRSMHLVGVEDIGHARQRKEKPSAPRTRSQLTFI